eukprot:gene4441-8852_t
MRSIDVEIKIKTLYYERTTLNFDDTKDFTATKRDKLMDRELQNARFAKCMFIGKKPGAPLGMEKNLNGFDTDIEEEKAPNDTESMTQLDENDSNTIFALDAVPKKDPSCNQPCNQWGLLRNDKMGQEFRLLHRIKDGRRDTYLLGRAKNTDIWINDRRVSSEHCLIYCDYSQARMRVYLEDRSVNGTYINDSLTRLHNGERIEIRSGFEIFLINPRSSTPGFVGAFLFINIMERIVGQNTVARAPQNILDRGHIGRHIEDFYVIGDQLGSGTCGQVHLCVHLLTRVQCAVKIIDTRKFSLSPGLSATDLREEAEMMSRLDHTNIIRIKDSFETAHTIYIVMELVRGGDLFDRIVERGKYDESNARIVMQKILSAVEYLHKKNIVHRDLKPENILLVDSSNDTEVKITDFGLAKRTNQEGLKTFCGTPQYFAPEVLKRKGTVMGTGRYGHEADMWSLGVVLYILLSGSFPFDEDNLFDQIEQAQYSLSGCEWSEVSNEAKHLVRSLLTLSPEQRLTAKQAIAHPWIRGEPEPVPELSSTATTAAAATVSVSASSHDANEVHVGDPISPTITTIPQLSQLTSIQSLTVKINTPNQFQDQKNENDEKSDNNLQNNIQKEKTEKQIKTIVKDQPSVKKRKNTKQNESRKLRAPMRTLTSLFKQITPVIMAVEDCKPCQEADLNDLFVFVGKNCFGLDTNVCGFSVSPVRGVVVTFHFLVTMLQVTPNIVGSQDVLYRTTPPSFDLPSKHNQPPTIVVPNTEKHSQILQPRLIWLDQCGRKLD